MKNKIIICTLAAFALAGCWKEPEITPTESKENASYELPQGNNDFDTRIMEIYQTTGSTLVYKFNESDLLYTGSVPYKIANVVKRVGKESNTNFLLDSVANILAADGMTVIDGRGKYLFPVDESYINRQLDLLEELCFDFYTDEQLRKLLPPTVYLTNVWANIDRTTSREGLRNAPFLLTFPALKGPTNMTFSFGGPRIDTITIAEKKYAKRGFNGEMLRYATDKGIIKRSAEFSAITTYTTAMGLAGSAITRRANGVLDTRYCNGGFGYIWSTYTNSYNVSEFYETITGAPSDWDSYVAWIVGTTSEEREAATGTVNFLHSSKDTAGKIRQKYDIMVSYMLDTYGIDLVAIGNTPVTQ